MFEDIIIQGIGILALICFLISFQIKSNKGLFIIQSAGSVFFSVQYLLLGSLTGCLNAAMAIIRNMLLCKMDQWEWVRWKGWVVIFCAGSIVIMIFTWQGITSIFATIALMGGTIGYWTNNAKYIRLCMLVAVSPSWLIYSIIIGSIGGTLNELLVMGSVLISIYRYGWKNLGSADLGNEKKIRKAVKE